MEYIGTVLAIGFISIIYIFCYERLNERYIKLKIEKNKLERMIDEKKTSFQKEELSDEDKKKQEQLRKNFNNLMGYGYEQALKSSKGE